MYAILAIGIVLLVYYLVVNQKNSDFIIYRFYSPTCKYCVESEPAWNAFAKLIETSKVPSFSTKKINMQGASKANLILNAKYGGTGQGVPYIIRVNTTTDAYDVYQGNRTANDLATWATSPMTVLSHKDSRSSTDLPN
jgi:hypothetical protein